MARLNLSKTFIWFLMGTWMVIGFGLACADPGQTPEAIGEQSPISHQTWDQLLQRHIDSEGWVDYPGFIQDSIVLNEYLDLLSNNPPASNWTEEEKLAYWINAYNAFTVKVIIDNYPLGSIRELHTIPGIATIWHKELFQIGGQAASLNQIEHKILRKEFAEPRIHFAINCASVSCPMLRAEAYTPEKLEAQLTEQAQLFLSQDIRNKISADKVQLSKIFRWFRGDFIKDGSLIDFLNQYAPVQISPDADISYLDYDWSLNGQKVNS